MNTPVTPTIFIVEDNPLFAAAVARVLRDRGYQARQFLSGEALLEGLKGEKPDLVLLDFDLGTQGGLSGDNVLRRLTDYRHRVPVIMLSNLQDIEKVLSLMRKGASDFISKDESGLRRLIPAIELVLSHERTRQELQTYRKRIRKDRKRLVITLCGIALGIAAYFLIRSL